MIVAFLILYVQYEASHLNYEPNYYILTALVLHLFH